MKDTIPPEYEEDPTPQAIEAERGALGSIILSPQALEEMEEVTSAGEELFYDFRHRIIFNALRMRYERGETIDVITLQQTLKDAGDLAKCGGIAYLNELMDSTPSPKQIPEYAAILREKYLLRRIKQLCITMVHATEKTEGGVDALMESLEAGVHGLVEERGGGEKLRPSKQAVLEVIEKAEYAKEHEGEITGVPFGFRELDWQTWGMHPGQLIVIGARPSEGKTAIGCNILLRNCVHNQTPALFFSLEMSQPEIYRRIMCSEARVDSMKVRRGMMNSGEYDRFATAASKVGACPLWVDDRSFVSPAQMRSITRYCKRRFGVSLVVVDYLQIIKPSRRTDSRHYDIGDSCAELKALAKDLQVPVIVLAQLNREFEKTQGKSMEKNRPPRKSDLGDSGMIERHADEILLLHRKVNFDDSAVMDVWPFDLIIDKGRDMAIDKIQLNFHKTFTLFEQVQAKPAVDSIPISRENGGRQ